MPMAPDEILYLITINGCARSCNERAIQLGNKLRQQMPKNLKEKSSVIGSLIEMLMKFGQVQDAEDLFRSFKNKDQVVYAAMVKGK